MLYLFLNFRYSVLTVLTYVMTIIFSFYRCRLFTSPKPPTPQQNKISPYKWVRQDFDHPSPEVNLVKKSLINKLDEVAKCKSYNANGYYI